MNLRDLGVTEKPSTLLSEKLGDETKPCPICRAPVEIWGFDICECGYDFPANYLAGFQDPQPHFNSLSLNSSILRLEHLLSDPRLKLAPGGQGEDSGNLAPGGHDSPAENRGDTMKNS